MIFRWFAAKRWLKSGLIGLGRVASDPKIILDSPLGGQTVVIPTHWIKYGLTAHALKPRDEVGVGVAEHMPHMQRSTHCGRWGINGEHLIAGGGAIKGVDAIGFPLGSPAVLDAVEGRLIGKSCHGPQGYGMAQPDRRVSRIDDF